MTGEVFDQRVRRGLGWSLANNLTLRIGNVAVSAIVARLLVPEEFGLFAVAMTVQLVLGVVAELGLGTDLVRSRDPEHRAPTVATIALLTSSALCALVVIGAEPLAGAFSAPDAAPVVRLMSLSLILSGLSVVPAAMLQRDFQQRRLFAADAGSLAVSTVVTIVLAVLGFGALALAWARIAGQATTAVLHFVLAGRRPNFGFDRVVLFSVLRFGAPLASANLLSWLVLTLDNLVVARQAGAVALGFYVLAFNVSSWPMSAIAQAVRVVALPAFARPMEARTRSRTLTAAVTLTWAGALTMAVPLAALAVPVIHVVFGARWVPAASALVGLAVFGAMRVVFDLVATYLIAHGAVRSVLAVQVAWALAIVPAIVLGVRWNGLAGAGWAHVVLATLVVAPAYGMALHRAGVGLPAMLWAVLPPLCASAPAMVVAWWTAQRIDHPLAAILSGGFLSVALYAALVFKHVRAALQDMLSVGVVREPDQDPSVQSGEHELQPSALLTT